MFGDLDVAAALELMIAAFRKPDRFAHGLEALTDGLALKLSAR